MSDQVFGARWDPALPKAVSPEEEPPVEFQISEETEREIEEIEANIRNAEQRSGLIILR